ncbi:MAG: histidine kinase dimerization/phospho-acceptor domain-containing protein [Bacteroidota bacterium]
MASAPQRSTYLPPPPSPLQKTIGFFRPLKDFFIKHPAVLSGYIIYAYLFISTMEFYRDFKEKHFTHFLDYFKSFDALIWMWLLAFALVKVIEYRTRVTQKQAQLSVREAELQTVHGMLRTLQHEINNPLAIVFLYLHQAERNAKDSPKLVQTLVEIRKGAERIAKTLRDFSNAQGYETVQSSVGDMIKPKTGEGQP